MPASEPADPEPPAPLDVLEPASPDVLETVDPAAPPWFMSALRTPTGTSLPLQPKTPAATPRIIHETKEVRSIFSLLRRT
jgi:hypothetical protein